MIAAPCPVQDAVDAVVRNCFRKARIQEAPVDPVRVARAIRLELHRVPAAAGYPRGLLNRHTQSALITDCDNVARMNFAIAHEIGEFLMPEIAQAADEIFEPRRREQIADLFAAALLMPTDWFAAHFARLGPDLPELQTRYSSASFEAVALRMLRITEAPAAVSIFDQGRPTRRLTNCSGWGMDVPQEIERRMATYIRGVADTDRRRLAGEGKHSPVVTGCAVRGNAPRDGSNEPRLTARGWAIDLPDWRREIVWTTFDDWGTA